LRLIAIKEFVLDNVVHAHMLAGQTTFIYPITMNSQPTSLVLPPLVPARPTSSPMGRSVDLQRSVSESWVIAPPILGRREHPVARHWGRTSFR